MKTFLVFIVALLIVISSQAQYRSDSTEYAIKIRKFNNMRGAGIPLTVIGTGLFVAGVVTMNNNLFADDSAFNTGFAVFMVGATSLGAGIPLWIVGAHQHKQYSERLRALRNAPLHVDAGMSFHGLTVRLRF